MTAVTSICIQKFRTATKNTREMRTFGDASSSWNKYDDFGAAISSGTKNDNFGAAIRSSSSCNVLCSKIAEKLLSSLRDLL